MTDAAGKGQSVQAGLGPAIGVGAAANAAVVRATAMPVAAARKARFTVAEQSVASRQGAEIRGEGALLRDRDVHRRGHGTPFGPGDPAPRNPGRRPHHACGSASRADEARSFGLPLPTGVTAEDFVRKPRRVDENGEEQELERHLPYDGKGSSVALSQVDTGPMVRAVLRMFATDPRLAGYLPAFGTTAPAPGIGDEEAETQRRNHRELTAALSETSLRVSKDQLLSTGLRVRLRRKTTMHS